MAKSTRIFDERVDLVLVADRAGLEEREAAMHGEHEDRAHQQEKDVRSLLHCHPPCPRSACFFVQLASAAQTAARIKDDADWAKKQQIGMQRVNGD